MSAVVVVATIIPVPEHRAEVITAFEQAIADVHAEDAGCLLYALNEGPDRLVMVEKWASAEDLQRHAEGAALQRLNSELDGKIIGGLDVQVLDPHPAGTATQGAV